MSDSKARRRLDATSTSTRQNVFHFVGGGWSDSVLLLCLHFFLICVCTFCFVFCFCFCFDCFCALTFMAHMHRHVFHILFVVGVVVAGSVIVIDVVVVCAVGD